MGVALKKKKKKVYLGVSALGQWGNDSALSLWWHRFNPWPGNFYMPRVHLKKEKKKKVDAIGSKYFSEKDGK